MAIAQKVTKNNHLPGEGDGRFPVYSKQFNELVDAFLELEGTDGVFTINTINEATTGSGVTVDSVLLKDGAGLFTAKSGYNTGAGGTVTQLTSITTGVTLNTVSGAITTVSSTLAAGAEATFQVTNSQLASTDVVVVNIGATSSAGTPMAFVSAVADGSFDITISNLHASAALNNTLTINFAVVKAVQA